METWSNFSASDLALAVIGLAGLASVVVVFSTASSKVNKREISLRQNARTQSEARD
jgi:uncharacterized membrane protein YuzA (DUF378 family)